MNIRQTYRGFSFFETILYVALFAVLATALLRFSWDIFDMGVKDRSSRTVFSETRFIASRLEMLIRNASGIDSGASVFNDDAGKIVLEQPNSSDTITILLQDGDILLIEGSSDAVRLNASDTQATKLSFLAYGTADDKAEYISFELSLSMVNNDVLPAAYQSGAAVTGGAQLRNSGL